MKAIMNRCMAAFLALILLVTAIPSQASAASTLDGKLPDASAFLRCNRHEDQDSRGTSWLHSYKMELNQNSVDASVEFLNLLLTPGYNLDLTDAREDDYTSISGHIFYTYIFTYTGNKKVGQYVDYDGSFEGNVQVSIYINYPENFLMVSYYFGDGFQVVDSGKHSSVRVTDLNGTKSGSTGSSGSSSDSTGRNGRRVPCGVCDNTGRCTKCGGDGYLYSSASKKQDRNCTHCHTHRGRCGSCGGDGWLN